MRSFLFNYSRIGLMLGAIMFANLSYADALLKVKDAVVRLPIPGQNSTAAYLTLTNTSKQSVVITQLSSNVAKKTELHTMRHENGMMRMRPLASLNVSAGQTVKLQPGSEHHVMLIGLHTDLKVGQRVELFLSMAAPALSEKLLTQSINVLVTERHAERNHQHKSTHEHTHHH